MLAMETEVVEPQLRPVPSEEAPPAKESEEAPAPTAPWRRPLYGKLQAIAPGLDDVAHVNRQQSPGLF